MKSSSILAWLVGASFVSGTAVVAQVFTGTGTGAIPDGGGSGPADWGSPLNVTFNVSGLSSPIGGMSLSITIGHSFAGDLEAVLIPPASSGASPFVIFSRVAQQVNFPFPGESTPGSPGSFGPNFGSTPTTYIFRDSASGNLWAASGFDTTTGIATFADSFDIAAGSYRTSVAGPWDVAGNPNGGDHNAGQLTSFATDSGFVGLTPTQANGTWTLRFRDGNLFDTGIVTAAELTVVPEPLHYALLTGFGLIAFAGYRRYLQIKA